MSHSKPNGANQPGPKGASTAHLPMLDKGGLLDALCARFPRIPREQWNDRLRRGRVLDAAGRPLRAESPWHAGMRVHYYREVAVEPEVPFEHFIVFCDEHLLVVDKPPFLPVAPTGAYVEQTLLARLRQRPGWDQLAPLHRIDRLTSGLLLFSIEPRTRSVYQALFRERRIDKVYHALAPALPDLAFPLSRESRIERGEPFFRMTETAGPANSRTRIEVIERASSRWLYALHPHSGRKHQLRVQMAALGAPIEGDPWYPWRGQAPVDDYQRPLCLLARQLGFVDPLDGRRRFFESVRRLTVAGGLLMPA